MRRILSLTLIATNLLISPLLASDTELEPSLQFWNELKKHCGNTYEGNFPSDTVIKEFGNLPMILEFRSCRENEIKMPFYVGDDYSRIWVLTLDENNRIHFQHTDYDPDGTDNDITNYGGYANNTGLAGVQIFPADELTAEQFPFAATNVWWLTIDRVTLSYNLKRLHSQRAPFTAIFDITNPIPNRLEPWGWELSEARSIEAEKKRKADHK